MTWCSWIVAALISSTILISLSATPVRAADEEADKSREEQIAERAKRRQYPGGSDESDLKVQNPLPVPTRKIAPAVEEERSESASQGED